MIDKNINFNERIYKLEELTPKQKEDLLSEWKSIYPKINNSKAIRLSCLNCIADDDPHRAEYTVRKKDKEKIINCNVRDCPIYEVKAFAKKTRRSLMKDFRNFCLDCMGDDVDGVRNCTDTKCPMYGYRFGHNPNITEETKKKLRERALRNDFISNTHKRLK